MSGNPFIKFMMRSLNSLGLDLVKTADLDRLWSTLAERETEMARLTVQLSSTADELSRQAKLAAKASLKNVMTLRPHEAGALTVTAAAAPPSPSSREYEARRTLPDHEIADRDSIQEALAAYGAVVIRRALPVDWLKRYRHRVEQYFDRIGEAARNGKFPGHAMMSEPNRELSALPLDTSPYRELGVPAGLDDIFNPLKASGVVDCARRFLSSEFVFLPRYSSVRRQLPTNDKALSFHQDGAAVSATADQCQGLVFWVPLTSVDEETPGLEIVLRRMGTLFPHVSEGSNNRISDSSRITRDYQDALVRTPNMAIGDVLLFSFDTIHRSFIINGMTKTRYSMDIRGVPIWGVPNWYTGWLVIP